MSSLRLGCWLDHTALIFVSLASVGDQSWVTDTFTVWTGASLAILSYHCSCLPSRLLRKITAKDSQRSIAWEQLDHSPSYTWVWSALYSDGLGNQHLLSQELSWLSHTSLSSVFHFPFHCPKLDQVWPYFIFFSSQHVRVSVIVLQHLAVYR